MNEFLFKVHKNGSSLIRRMAKEALIMLAMPEILLALNFEAEMGAYFEVTSHWHAMPGVLSNR